MATVIAVFSMGVVIDSLSTLAGVMSYSSVSGWFYLLPPWYIGLWLGYAMSVEFSLNIIFRKQWITVVCTLILPAVYYFSQDLRVITLYQPVMVALLIILVLWYAMLNMTRIILSVAESQFRNEVP